jgi:hypothetical protein
MKHIISIISLRGPERAVAIPLIIFLFLFSACAAKDAMRYPPVRWLADADMTPADMPKVNKRYELIDSAEKTAYEQFQYLLAASEQTSFYSSRIAAGKLEALNVNNFDEVPDSSWFTNRIGRYDMTPAEILRFPDKGKAPRFSNTITVLGVALYGPPRLVVEDSSKTKYVLKFDRPGRPGLAANSELLTSRILYSAGYNVPESYVIELDTGNLVLGTDAIAKHRYDKKTPMTEEDLKVIVEKITGGNKGRIRALATRICDGILLGPFSFSGKRHDDKNDRIPHEHRRELRGYRVFSAFLNNVDLLEDDTLDVFTATRGIKGHVVHNLFDLSSTFGNTGGWDDKKEKDMDLDADKFDPAGWKPSFPNSAFSSMTNRDAFWAAKILARFPDDAITALVKNVKYAEEETSNYVIRSLIERKDKIIRYWFSILNPLDNFRLMESADKITVFFDDLGIKYGIADGGETKYRYMVKTLMGRADLTDWFESAVPMIEIEREIIDKMEINRVYTLKIETKRSGEEWWMPPVDLFIKKADKDIELIGLLRRNK